MMFLLLQKTQVAAQRFIGRIKKVHKVELQRNEMLNVL